MRMKALTTLALLLALTASIHGQDSTGLNWDDTAAGHWPKGFQEIGITSSADGSCQKAMMYRARSRAPRPLIVSLHTWSGDHRQEDPIAASIPERDYHYLHPDFRGPNTSPRAC